MYLGRSCFMLLQVAALGSLTAVAGGASLRTSLGATSASCLQQSLLKETTSTQPCRRSITGLPHQQFPTPSSSSSSSRTTKPHLKLFQHPILPRAQLLRLIWLNQGNHPWLMHEQSMAHLHIGPVQAFHHSRYGIAKSLWPARVKPWAWLHMRRMLLVACLTCQQVPAQLHRKVEPNPLSKQKQTHPI